MYRERLGAPWHCQGTEKPRVSRPYPARQFGRNRSRPIDDVRDGGRSRCPRRARRTAGEPPKGSPKSLFVRREGRRAEGQSTSAWSDLRGGSSGIALPKGGGKAN